jgi:hypothetical protein
MADEEVENAVQRVDPMEDPTLDWVGPKPRGTASVITPTLLDVFGVLEENPEEENYVAYAPKHYKKNVTLRHLHCNNLAITVAICLFYEFSNGLCDTLVNRRNILAILKRQFIFLQRPLKSLAPIFIL